MDCYTKADACVYICIIVHAIKAVGTKPSKNN